MLESCAIKEIGYILFQEDNILGPEGQVPEQDVQDLVVIDQDHIVEDRGPMDEVDPGHMDEGQDLGAVDHVLDQDQPEGIYEDHHIVDMWGKLKYVN